MNDDPSEIRRKIFSVEAIDENAAPAAAEFRHENPRFETQLSRAFRPSFASSPAPCSFRETSSSW